MPQPKLEVVDRLAIQDLLAAYSWALDTGDVEAMVQLFTEDALLVMEVFEEPDVWEGRDAIRRFAEHYLNAPDFPGRQHHISQSMFEGGGGRVQVKSFVFVTECRGEPPYAVRFTGWYDDVVIEDHDERWRFQSRIVRMWEGAVLKNFPGQGQRVPRKRPEPVTKR